MKQRRKQLTFEIEKTGIFVKPGTTPRVRIRTLIRRGWYLVEVPAIWADEFSIVQENNIHYRALVEWCKTNVPVSDWASALHSTGSRPDLVGNKRFAFKEAKFATWFKLMNDIV